MSSIPSDKSAQAVIVSRVSRDQQEQNTSHEAQLAICTRKLQDLGATLLAYFPETISGALYRARPKMQTALELIESGQAQYLILARLDRMGRDVDALRDIKRRVEKAGAQLVFADGLNFQSGAVGNLLFNQLSSFAEFEREMIRERMVSGQRTRALQGIQVARNTAPWGYHIVQHKDVIRGTYPADMIGQYIPKDKETVWPWIEAIYEKTAAQESERGICAWLMEQGVNTPRGGRVWRQPTLRSIIRNPVYKGEPGFGKNQYFTDETRRLRGLKKLAYCKPRPDSEVIKLSAPAVVSPALWQAANDAREAGRQERSGRTDRKHLLTGLLRCPQCGKRFYSRTTQGRLHKDGSRGRRVLNYRCQASVERAKIPKDMQRLCPSPAYGGATLEKLVIEAFLELLHTPRLMSRAQDQYLKQRKGDKSTQNEAAKLKQLEQDIAACHRREEALAESLIEARLNNSDGSAFTRLLGETETRRKALEQRLEAIAARRAAATLPGSPLPQLEPKAVEQIAAALTSPTIPPAQKGILLGRSIERIYPVPKEALPPEVQENLQGSARQLRIAAGKEKGHLIQPSPIQTYEFTREELKQRLGKRVVGGVQIVLRTQRPGPYYILSRVLVGRTPYRDNSGRDGFKLHYQTTLRIEASDPFPLNNMGRAQFEAELWREQEG